MRWLHSITGLMDMSLSKFWKIGKDREAWHATVHGATKNLTQLSDQIKTWYVTEKLKQTFWPTH